MTETAPFLGISGWFDGDDDPRAPLVRALSWIWDHSGLSDVELADDQRAIVVLDLAGAVAELAIVPRGGEDEPRSRRMIEGGDLGEVLEAGAALAALCSPGEIPRWFDLGGDLKRIVTFVSHDRQADLLAAWTALRENADRPPDRG